MSKRPAPRSLTDLRAALGSPFVVGHSGCAEGPHVQLIYETVAEAMRAHEALRRLLDTYPTGADARLSGDPHPHQARDGAGSDPETPVRPATRQRG